MGSDSIDSIELFKNSLDQKTLDELREATNKCWACGNDKFKQAAAMRLARRVEPMAKGGDRKSSHYRAKINRV